MRDVIKGRKPVTDGTQVGIVVFFPLAWGDEYLTRSLHIGRRANEERSSLSIEMVNICNS